VIIGGRLASTARLLVAARGRRRRATAEEPPLEDGGAPRVRGHLRLVSSHAGGPAPAQPTAHAPARLLEGAPELAHGGVAALPRCH
jgi:hypothetical protein